MSDIDALRELVARWQAEADAREKTLGWYDPACAMQDKCADALEAVLPIAATEPDPVSRLTDADIDQMIGEYATSVASPQQAFSAARAVLRAALTREEPS